MVGSSTVTLFGTTTPPAVKLMFDVVGLPVAVPGRTETNPAVVGNTAVTLATIAVAPAGTGAVVDTVVPSAPTVEMLPVTCRLRGAAEANGPPNPGSRVSSTRTGAMATNADDGESARTE